MNSYSTPGHVAVLGGGIFGVSTAVQLARRDIRVTLVTDGALASGASGRSLAWLNTAGHRSLPYHTLRLAGIDRWKTWRLNHPEHADALHFSGGLTWTGDGESFRDRHDHERSLGYDSVWVSADQAADLVPGIDPGAVAAEGAIFNPGEGWVDLPTVIGVLAAEVRDRGGRVVENAGRCSVVTGDGRATAVATGDGSRIDADAVVVAAGPQTPALLGETGVGVGDDSPAAFVAVTRPVESDLQTVLNTPNVAIRRAVDGGLVMDSGWSEETVRVAEDGSLDIDDAVVARLMEEASAVLAGHPTLELDHIGAGYKPIPGDGEPVVGRVDGVDGLYTAFSHSGATLGLLVGELLAAEIADGVASPLLDTFRPSRFRRGE